MEDKMGIEQLTKLALAGAKLGNVAGLVLEDGKLGLTDLRHLGKASGAVNEIMTIDFDKGVKEWKDLDATEKESLCKTFSDELDLEGEANDKIEAKAEEAFCVGLDLYQSIKKAIDMVKGWKKA